MTVKAIQYKRGRPHIKIGPLHTNSRRQETQTRVIKICTTITQIETSSSSTSEIDTLEVRMGTMKNMKMHRYDE